MRNSEEKRKKTVGDIKQTAVEQNYKGYNCNVTVGHRTVECY